MLRNAWNTALRPLVGAAAALAVFLFLNAGLIQFSELSDGLMLAVAFVAGFSERLLMRVVEQVASEETTPRSTEERQ